MPPNPHFTPVPLDKAYRLLNHGPTVLVSASHAGEDNAMAAAWACALDFAPPKVTVVLDKATRTRQLIEASGHFALSAGLNPKKDAIALESAKSPYVNLIAVREADKNQPWVAKLLKAYQSEEIRKFIEVEFKGSVLPGF